MGAQFGKVLDSIKRSESELNSKEPLEDPPGPPPPDPRLPLTAKQLFNITKSWKGIARAMEPTGIIMSVKERKKIPQERLNYAKLLLILIRSFCAKSRATGQMMSYQALWNFRNSFRKEGIYFLSETFNPTVLLFKPETVEPILKGNQHLQKGAIYNFFKPFMPGGYLLSSGQEFRYKKKLFAPIFKVSEDFIHICNEQADVLVEKLIEEMESQEFLDIQPIISLCSFDIMYETMMGLQLNSQVKGAWPFYNSLNETTTSMIYRGSQPWQWFDWIYYRTKAGKHFIKHANITKSFNEQVIARKLRDENILLLTTSTDFSSEISPGTLDKLFKQDKIRTHKRMSFYDVLLPICKESEITFGSVISDINNILFAGHDTTAATVCWTLYNLGLYPKIQHKVHDELDRVLGQTTDSIITAEDIKKLTYLECVTKEAMRLFTPVAIISRIIENDMHINGYKVRKGTDAIICIDMIHKDPDVFPNPEVFDPDRFQSSNCTELHPYAFLSFSTGMRNCLGQKMALSEIVVLVAKILLRFEVKAMLPIEKITMHFGPALRSKNGLPLCLKLR